MVRATAGEGGGEAGWSGWHDDNGESYITQEPGESESGGAFVGGGTVALLDRPTGGRIVASMMRQNPRLHEATVVMEFQTVITRGGQRNEVARVGWTVTTTARRNEDGSLRIEVENMVQSIEYLHDLLG